MTSYPDTSFLGSMYRRQVHTSRALAFKTSMDEPLYFSPLLEFEFIQSIRLQVWLHQGGRTQGCPAGTAGQMIADWESDIAAGLNVLVPIDHDAVLRLARTYSLQHTAKGGHRTLDLLHVATAVHLGARNFLTFDIRQRALARRAGLKVPL